MEGEQARSSAVMECGARRVNANACSQRQEDSFGHHDGLIMNIRDANLSGCAVGLGVEWARTSVGN